MIAVHRSQCDDRIATIAWIAPRKTDLYEAKLLPITFLLKLGGTNRVGVEVVNILIGSTVQGPDAQK